MVRGPALSLRQKDFSDQRAFGFSGFIARLFCLRPRRLKASEEANEDGRAMGHRSRSDACVNRRADPLALTWQSRGAGSVERRARNSAGVRRCAERRLAVA